MALCASETGFMRAGFAKSNRNLASNYLQYKCGKAHKMDSIYYCVKLALLAGILSTTDCS